MARPNYKQTLNNIVARLNHLGVDIAVMKDAQGYTLTTRDGRSKIGGPYPGKEAVIFITAYIRGREAEVIAQMAGQDNLPIGTIDAIEGGVEGVVELETEAGATEDPDAD